MNTINAIVWREWTYFRKHALSITLTSLVSPLLYVIAFGYGLGRFVSIGDTNYLSFLIPGIIAINTMNTSFSAVATPLVISRIHDKSLETYITAPSHTIEIMTGKIFAATLRGFYSGTIILLAALLLRIEMKITPPFIGAMFINSLLFASMGFTAAMMVKSHQQMAQFRTFFINPMVFVCGTFFSTKSVPSLISKFLIFLPLTPSTTTLRSAALAKDISFWPLGIQLLYIAALCTTGYNVFMRYE